MNGKMLVTYNPTKQSSHDEIGTFLSQFELNDSLRRIGLISKTFLDNSRPTFRYIEQTRRVPITSAILAYIAMRLIEHAEDSKKKELTINDIATAADMWFGLPDPYHEDNNSEELINRVGLAQFEFQLDYLHFIPRALLIYRDIWKTVEECKVVDIEKEIQNLSGLTIEQILILGYWFVVQDGYSVIFDEKQVAEYDQVATVLTTQNQRKFSKWLEISYSDFRKLCEEEKAKYGNDLYKFDQYRLNPLYDHPLIKPNKTPSYVSHNSICHLVPVAYLLYKRITQGLYFELTKKFSIPNVGNQFRNTFGYAFEAYIVKLLENYSKNRYTITKEFKFIHQRNEKKTPDCLFIDNNRLVLIEAKQSALRLETKIRGTKEEFKKDIAKSIAEGVEQIYKFEEIIKTGNVPDLHYLKDKQLERLVIVYDQLYFSNSVVRECIREVLKERERKPLDLPVDYYWHVISIEQFEHLVGNEDTNLFDYLKTKRTNTDFSNLDFKEYLSRTNKLENNKLLSQTWQNLMDSIDQEKQAIVNIIASKNKKLRPETY